MLKTLSKTCFSSFKCCLFTLNRCYLQKPVSYCFSYSLLSKYPFKNLTAPIMNLISCLIIRRSLKNQLNKLKTFGVIRFQNMEVKVRSFVPPTDFRRQQKLWWPQSAATIFSFLVTHFILARFPIQLMYNTHITCRNMTSLCHDTPPSTEKTEKE